MSADVNESVLKKELDTLIEQKEIHIGHLIMPKNIEKLILKNNELIKEYFDVYAKKIRLYEIKKALIERLNPYRETVMRTIIKHFLWINVQSYNR